jgi:hypothetical protein
MLRPSGALVYCAVRRYVWMLQDTGSARAGGQSAERRYWHARALVTYNLAPSTPVAAWCAFRRAVRDDMPGILPFSR